MKTNRRLSIFISVPCIFRSKGRRELPTFVGLWDPTGNVVGVPPTRLVMTGGKVRVRWFIGLGGRTDRVKTMYRPGTKCTVFLEKGVYVILIYTSKK